MRRTDLFFPGHQRNPRLTVVGRPFRVAGIRVTREIRGQKRQLGTYSPVPAVPVSRNFCTNIIHA